MWVNSRPRSIDLPSRQWFHRDAVENYAADDWWQEVLSTWVCRYLNSGLAVIITTGDHALAVCGYLRQRHISADTQFESYHEPNIDMAEKGTTDSVSSVNLSQPDADRIAAFIVHDDQRGPYRLVSVQEVLSLSLLASSTETSSSSEFAIAPLPHGLWLSGAEAEEHGAAAIVSTLDLALGQDRLRKIFGHWNESTLQFFVRTLNQLKQKIDTHKLAIRSYATTSADYKLSFGMRCSDQVARGAVNLARLPRFVWVIEAVERARRGSVGKPVVAQAVLDAGSPARSTNRLIVQMPGLVQIQEPGWVGTDQESRLIPCELTCMDSGRWSELEISETLAAKMKRYVPSDSAVGL